MKRKRKPKPEPPKWFFYDNDNCWFCSNRNNCGSCHLLKEFRSKFRDKKIKETLYD